MKPGLVETAQRGGHLFLLDLQQATLSLSDFKLLDNGYFVTQVKQIDDIGLKSMTKTFFPVSNSDMENLEIVMDVIKNPKNIELIYPKTINEIVDDVTVEITSQLDINFKICVKNKIATFFRSDEVI
ncbi:hypothetical protein KBC04_02445 [Candidatus Babeliales bacterium]|nr:hypothetical protein [Candidatus Babeliales bacterium]MBP9843730.1 hypothetical protein [Candidatus Babeliales bacterium]